MEPSDWTDIGFGFTLRCWQDRAIKRLLHQIEAGARSLCLIAPPGAGKTVCALALAAELERPVEVRVPTTALVNQWEQRIKEALVKLSPAARRPPFRVATYASNTPCHAGALLLMDEAHHLTARWGERVHASFDPANQILVGLTATPPYESVGWDRFVDLFGAAPVEIPAPPLVREAQLAPFQDLVWPVIADVDDVPELTAYDDQLTALEADLGASFTLWQEKMLLERWWELTEARFADQSGLLVALCRIRHGQGRSLPSDVVMEDELIATPTLEDRALVIWSFGQSDASVVRRLKQIGFTLRKSGPSLRDNVAWKALSHADARVEGALDVLALEAAQRADFLRALVVCNRDVEGEVLSARQVLKTLVRDPRTADLDPILVSGTVFWVDEDIYMRLQPHFQGGAWVKHQHHYELDVSDWPTSERVALATGFLINGVTRCLVGTRHLLGEGWDCPPVNCVIDVTGISASVTVNQIRGRGLRPDPNDPSKVASLWDIISVVPGVPDGDRMLTQLRARHANTFGLDDAGRIRSGVARIHPALAGPSAAAIAQIDAIQQHMRHRVVSSARSASQWAVGQDYLDAQQWTIERPADWSLSSPMVRERKPLTASHSASKTSLAVTQRRRVRDAWRYIILGSTLGPLLGATEAIFQFGLGITPGDQSGFGSVLVVLAMSSLVLTWGLFKLRRTRLTADRVPTIIQALHSAWRAQDPTLGALQTDGPSWWVESEPHGEAFARAASTLLSPIRFPRYLLVEQDGTIFPIPSPLASNRTRADAFASAWAKHLGSCSVLYARSAEGKALLREVWKKQGVRSSTLEIVQLWK